MIMTDIKINRTSPRGRKSKLSLPGGTFPEILENVVLNVKFDLEMHKLINV